MSHEEQLALPIAARAQCEVSWFNVAETAKRRRFIGKQTVRSLLYDEDTGLASRTTIRAEDIDEVKDAKLRYALRFAAAAKAAGWEPDGFGAGIHSVTIHATDEGLNSRLVGEPIYSGRSHDGGDTFMENLRRFAPDYGENCSSTSAEGGKE